jgi:hypothetical protein
MTIRIGLDAVVAITRTHAMGRPGSIVVLG